MHTAGVLGATTLLLVLLLLDGTEASRYCSYHPEAPECRNVQPRYPPASDWEVDPAHLELQEMEADLAAAISTSNEAGAAVINSTSMCAIDSLDAHLADDVPPSAVSTPAKGMGEASGWRLLLTRQARPVFEALGVVGAALVTFAVLARWWVHRQARQIDALEDVAAAEALLTRRAASPFAVVVDATLGTSLVSDLRRRLEARLAQLHARRQQSLDAAAAELAGQASVADRKHQFVKKWRRIHAKTLPIPQLEALLAEAEEVESEFEVVIREWLEFRRQIERESTTLRLTMSEDGESLPSSLTRSTELRLLAAARPNAIARYTNDSDDDDDDAVIIERDDKNSSSTSTSTSTNTENEGEVEVVEGQYIGGERNAAKRRSTNGPLGSLVLEDYGGENDSSIARELARQTDSESYFRVWELHHKHELLQLGREKLRQKQEDKIQEQQKREEDNEERRSQARRTLKEQQEANRIEQEKLNHQKQEARKAAEEAEERTAWSSLRTRLFLHASIYGGIALYHLWHSLLDSWRSTLDFSSTCTPAIPLLVDKVCLLDLTVYLPLHILLPLLLCVLVLAIQWGGLLLQLPSLAALCLLFAAIWSKVPSALDYAGLVGVVVVQLLVFAAKWAIASSANDGGEVGHVRQRAPRRLLGAVLTTIEVSLFVVNIGLALACFARRRNDVLHDSFTDCFSTPSDFGSCYTYY